VSDPNEFRRMIVLLRSPLPSQAAALYRRVSDDDPVVTLATTLAASARWEPASPITFVVRPGPEPVLAAVGAIDAEAEARLTALRWQLATVLPHLRYFDHAAVEAACMSLAMQVRERLGEATLTRARFVAVPRGGLVVLGYLAYALGLRRDQVVSAVEPGVDGGGPDAPLVVVDDCALSGYRMSRVLDGLAANQVVIATLCSHPEMRLAFVQARPGVIGFESAVDLVDHAPAIYGREYPAWLARWQERSEPGTVWVGRPDHVCFPWHEPDVGVWDPVRNEVALGWGLVPPELCLAHRERTSRAKGGIAVQVVDGGGGSHRPTRQVVFGSVDGAVIVGRLDTESTFVLDDVAAAMWHGLTERRAEEDVVASIAERYDVDTDVVRADLRGLRGQLVAAGLLEPVTGTT
jgi:hypothetical protein